MKKQEQYRFTFRIKDHMGVRTVGIDAPIGNYFAAYDRLIRNLKLTDKQRPGYIATVKMIESLDAQ